VEPDEEHIKSDDLQSLVTKLEESYPGLTLSAYEADYKIHIQEIRVENKGQGIGTKVIRELQEYARRVDKPIVLSPEPEPRKKQALFRFYKSLGFVVNKGRKRNYMLSLPFGPTMYWKP
jgi:ribosomal protein S18 acetylase RimI-like enzyme